LIELKIQIEAKEKVIESLQIDLHSAIQDGLSTTGMATEAQVSLFSLFLRLEHDI
jgi:hypothetical protein